MTELAAGPLGSSGGSEATTVGGSLLEEYGPWLSVGAAGLVVLVGAVLTLRSRRDRS